MPFDPRMNSGALFQNDRNNKSDLTGQIQLTCPECGAVSGWWMNAWNKTSQKGLGFISVVLKPKRETAAAGDHGRA